MAASGGTLRGQHQGRVPRRVRSAGGPCVDCDLPIDKFGRAADPNDVSDLHLHEPRPRSRSAVARSRSAPTATPIARSAATASALGLELKLGAAREPDVPALGPAVTGSAMPDSSPSYAIENPPSCFDPQRDAGSIGRGVQGTGAIRAPRTTDARDVAPYTHPTIATPVDVRKSRRSGTPTGVTGRSSSVVTTTTFNTHIVRVHLRSTRRLGRGHAGQRSRSALPPSRAQRSRLLLGRIRSAPAAHRLHRRRRPGLPAQLLPGLRSVDDGAAGAERARAAGSERGDPGRDPERRARAVAPRGRARRDRRLRRHLAGLPGRQRPALQDGRLGQRARCRGALQRRRRAHAFPVRAPAPAPARAGAAARATVRSTQSPIRSVCRSVTTRTGTAELDLVAGQRIGGIAGQNGDVRIPLVIVGTTGSATADFRDIAGEGMPNVDLAELGPVDPLGAPFAQRHRRGRHVRERHAARTSTSRAAAAGSTSRGTPRSSVRSCRASRVRFVYRYGPGSERRSRQRLGAHLRQGSGPGRDPRLHRRQPRTALNGLNSCDQRLGFGTVGAKTNAFFATGQDDRALLPSGGLGDACRRRRRSSLGTTLDASRRRAEPADGEHGGRLLGARLAVLHCEKRGPARQAQHHRVSAHRPGPQMRHSRAGAGAKLGSADDTDRRGLRRRRQLPDAWRTPVRKTARAASSLAARQPDGVGDACDNCVSVDNPLVLAARPVPHREPVGDAHRRSARRRPRRLRQPLRRRVQRVARRTTAADTAQYNASIGRRRAPATPAARGNSPCAIFDIMRERHEASPGGISASDIGSLQAAARERRRVRAARPAPERARSRCRARRVRRVRASDTTCEGGVMTKLRALGSGYCGSHRSHTPLGRMSSPTKRSASPGATTWSTPTPRRVTPSKAATRARARAAPTTRTSAATCRSYPRGAVATAISRRASASCVWPHRAGHCSGNPKVGCLTNDQCADAGGTCLLTTDVFGAPYEPTACTCQGTNPAGAGFEATVCGGALRVCSDGDPMRAVGGLGIALGRRAHARRPAARRSPSSGPSVTGSIKPDSTPVYEIENPPSVFDPQRDVGTIGRVARPPDRSTRCAPPTRARCSATSTRDRRRSSTRRCTTSTGTRTGATGRSSPTSRRGTFNTHVVTVPATFRSAGWSGRRFRAACTVTRPLATEGLRVALGSDAGSGDRSPPAGGQRICPPNCNKDFSLATSELQELFEIAAQDPNAGIQLAVQSGDEGPGRQAGAGDAIEVTHLFRGLLIVDADLRCRIGGWGTGLVGRCVDGPAACSPRVGCTAPGQGVSCRSCGGPYDAVTNPLGLPVGYNTHGRPELDLVAGQRIGGITGQNFDTTIPLFLIRRPETRPPSSATSRRRAYPRVDLADMGPVDPGSGFGERHRRRRHVRERRRPELWEDSCGTGGGCVTWDAATLGTVQAGFAGGFQYRYGPGVGDVHVSDWALIYDKGPGPDGIPGCIGDNEPTLDRGPLLPAAPGSGRRRARRPTGSTPPVRTIARDAPGRIGHDSGVDGEVLLGNSLPSVVAYFGSEHNPPIVNTVAAFAARDVPYFTAAQHGPAGEGQHDRLPAHQRRTAVRASVRFRARDRRRHGPRRRLRQRRQLPDVANPIRSTTTAMATMTATTARRWRTPARKTVPVVSSRHRTASATPATTA